MPAKRPAARGRASTGGYTKFSDKLTDSLDDISAMIKDHQEMIDTIQEVALELTGTIGSLHTVTVKYAGKANQFLDLALPILKNIPIIPDKVVKLLDDLEKWTQKIIDNQAKTERTITSVQSGLRTGDVSKIKGQAGELKKVSQSLKKLVPARS